MKNNVWLINPNKNAIQSAHELLSPEQQIQMAEPFTVSLISVMVADKLDGILGGGNDLLIMSSTSQGTAPHVPRVHHYKENIPPHTLLNGFYSDTIHVCNDFSGKDRLWIDLNVVEIDTDNGDRKAVINSFSTLAATASGIFPAVLPYAAAASVAATVVDKFLTAVEKNVSALEATLALYPGPLDPMRMPLQAGVFVVFAHPVDGTLFRPDGPGSIKRFAGGEPEISYAIVSIKKEEAPSPEYLVDQRIATLLTQIKSGNDQSPEKSISFLADTLQQYGNFKDIQRYDELRRKAPGKLSDPEKALMDKLAAKEAIKAYLPL